MFVESVCVYVSGLFFFLVYKERVPSRWFTQVSPPCMCAHERVQVFLCVHVCLSPLGRRGGSGWGHFPLFMN